MMEGTSAAGWSDWPCLDRSTEDAASLSVAVVKRSTGVVATAGMAAAAAAAAGAGAGICAGVDADAADVDADADANVVAIDDIGGDDNNVSGCLSFLLLLLLQLPFVLMDNNKSDVGGGCNCGGVDQHAAPAVIGVVEVPWLLSLLLGYPKLAGGGGGGESTRIVVSLSLVAGFGFGFGFRDLFCNWFCCCPRCRCS